MRQIVLGLDGGGTKTVCVAMDAEERVLAQSRTASSNRNSVGDAAARTHMIAAVTQVLQDVGAEPADVSAICLGMAGVDRPADRARVSGWIGDTLPGVPQLIHNDAVAAMASGTRGDLYGVVIISGTGMIVYGFDRAGNSVRAGGWGALLGDEGSGYKIGSAILHAITAAVDGRGPDTALCDAVLAHLQLPNASALIDWAYIDTSWQRFAALSPLAMEWSRRGDPVAIAIVEQAAHDLATAARAVVRKLTLGTDGFPLVLAGGNLRPGPLFDALSREIRDTIPEATITQPQVDPAVGAALLALKSSPQQRDG